MDYDCQDLAGLHRFPSHQLLESFPLRRLVGLPQETGVYIPYSPSVSQPLYTGRAKILSNRVSLSRNHAILRKICVDYPDARVALLHWPWRITVDEFASKEAHDEVKAKELKNFECAAIQFYQPRLNKIRPKANMLCLYDEDDPACEYATLAARSSMHNYLDRGDSEVFDYEDLAGLHRFPSYQLLRSVPLMPLREPQIDLGVGIVYSHLERQCLYVGAANEFYGAAWTGRSRAILLKIYSAYPDARVGFLYWPWSITVRKSDSEKEHDALKAEQLKNFLLAAIQFYEPVFSTIRPEANMLRLHTEDN